MWRWWKHKSKYEDIINQPNFEKPSIYDKNLVKIMEERKMRENLRVHEMDMPLINCFQEDTWATTVTVNVREIPSHPHMDRMMGDIMQKKHELEAIGYEPKFIFIGKKLYENLINYNWRLTGGVSFDEFIGLQVIYDEDFMESGFKIKCSAKDEYLSNPNRKLRNRMYR